MIWTFFYGSWIDLKILKEKDFFPEQHEIARLYGFGIYIQPIANLIPSDSQVVYGILLATTREKHQKIFTALTRGTMGSIYLPEAVLVETLEGKLKPALCYIASRAELKPANPDYLNPFVQSAKEWKFPQWYIKHLESFR
ncbi:MAG: hypothetical protein K1000chlam3_00067 [Chlamydiae bacterium]|nr:hypothetical protein [Chlamydiota bacterium]